MAKVWSKRFDNTLDPFIEKFNASIGLVYFRRFRLLDCSCKNAWQNESFILLRSFANY